MNDGGYGRSASPVYHQFVEQAKKLEPRYLTFVIPARWFAGGKGLDEFRTAMLEDMRTRVLVDYLTASDVFAGIGLKGGICYFLWDRDHPGPCRVSTHFADWPVSTSERRLLEPGADVFIRFNEGVSILRKVVRVETGAADSLTLPEEKRFDTLVSARKPFGLATTFRGKHEPATGDLLVYRNGGIGYTPRKAILASVNAIDKWKIFVGRAGPGTGNRDTYPHKIISTPFIGGPGTVSSETYLYIGPFDSESQAQGAMSYLACRLTRFLILLHKPAQGTTRQVYAFVPAQDWSKTWTDEQLYKKYGLTDSEIAFVEKVVRPMDFNDDQNDEAFADADDDE